MQHIFLFIEFGVIWCLSFLYFFIPAFVAYFVKGNAVRKLVAGFGSLTLLFGVVWFVGVFTAQGAKIQQENIDIITYAIAVSFLGVFGAVISTEIEKRMRKAHK